MPSPFFGKRRCETSAMVVEVLEPIWHEKAQTAPCAKSHRESAGVVAPDVRNAMGGRHGRESGAVCERPQVHKKLMARATAAANDMAVRM